MNHIFDSGKLIILTSNNELVFLGSKTWKETQESKLGLRWVESGWKSCHWEMYKCIVHHVAGNVLNTVQHCSIHPFCDFIIEFSVLGKFIWVFQVLNIYLAKAFSWLSKKLLEFQWDEIWSNVGRWYARHLTGTLIFSALASKKGSWVPCCREGHLHPREPNRHEGSNVWILPNISMTMRGRTNYLCSEG